MRSHIVRLLLFITISPVVIADQGQHYQDNVNWAKQADGLIRNQSGYSGFSADELCKDAACRQGLANPEQTRYRNDATAMESAKTAAMATDEKAQAVTTNFNKGRPTIDPKDPTWPSPREYKTTPTTSATASATSTPTAPAAASSVSPMSPTMLARPCVPSL